jgi:DNA-binding NarL/FixJ family response regulator
MADGAATPDSIDIPSQLRRIADLVEAATALESLAERTASLGLASATDLSPRQWEIVGRIARGERVPTIAAEMYLSRSTVRNHLSAIFAKVGVHSQDELVSLYRKRDVENSTERGATK